jgi:hypothetical protein
MDLCDPHFLDFCANNERSRVRRLRLLFVTSCFLLFAGFVAGQEQNNSAGARVTSFNIPAQPLALALQAYGEATGVQILYESQSARGRRSLGVIGKFSSDAALARLLTGTGLQVRRTGLHAITLSLPQQGALWESSLPAAAAPAANLDLGTLFVRATAQDDDGSQLRDYTEMIKLDVQGALEENALTRRGRYHFIANLWINLDNRIERTDLSQSTGDQERDDAVIGALQNLKLSAHLPAGAPRPVRVAVSVKPYNE